MIWTQQAAQGILRKHAMARNGLLTLRKSPKKDPGAIPINRAPGAGLSRGLSSDT